MEGWRANAEKGSEGPLIPRACETGEPDENTEGLYPSCFRLPERAVKGF